MLEAFVYWSRDVLVTISKFNYSLFLIGQRGGEKKDAREKVESFLFFDFFANENKALSFHHLLSNFHFNNKKLFGVSKMLFL